MVDVELKEANPHTILYHGTSSDSLNSILNEGLRPRTRLHDHLSSDVDTYIQFVSRHWKPIVLKIDANRMDNDGVHSFLSNNGVWLTDYVDPKYLSLIE